MLADVSVGQECRQIAPAQRYRIARGYCQMPHRLTLQWTTVDGSTTGAGDRTHKLNAAVVVRITSVEVIADELYSEALNRSQDYGGIHPLGVGAIDERRAGEQDALSVCWKVLQTGKYLSIGGEIRIDPTCLIFQTDLNVLDALLGRGLACRKIPQLVEAQEMNSVIESPIHAQFACELPVDTCRP